MKKYRYVLTFMCNVGESLDIMTWYEVSVTVQDEELPYSVYKEAKKCIIEKAQKVMGSENVAIYLISSLKTLADE